MSDPKKYLAGKFSGFEPEVENAAIDQSWERIKYFLPQEKKRRRFFFFRTPGHGGLLRSLSVLCLAAGLTAAWFWWQGPEGNDPGAESPDATVHTENKKEGSPEQAGRPGKQSPGSLKNGAEEKVSALSPVPLSGTPAPEKQSAYAAAPAEIPFILQATGPAPAASAAEGAQEEGFVSPVADNAALPAAGQDDRLPGAVWLTPIFLDHLPENEQPDPISVSIPEIPPAPVAEPPASGKWSLELFGGPALVKTDLVQQGAALGPDAGRQRFSMGLGARYQWSRKWSLHAQLRLTGNRLDHSEQTDGNKVLDKRMVVSSAIPLANDTTFLYAPSRSVKKIRSVLSYDAGLGIGYALLQKNRWVLDASVQLNLRYAAYRFSNSYEQDSDTLRYVQTVSSGPLPGQGLVTEREYDERRAVISLGIAPGLSLAYRLNGRMRIFLKASGLIGFSENSIRAGNQAYGLKQQSLFLDLGLRLAL